MRPTVNASIATRIPERKDIMGVAGAPPIVCGNISQHAIFDLRLLTDAT